MPLIKLPDGRYAIRYYENGRKGRRRYETLGKIPYSQALRTWKERCAGVSQDIHRGVRVCDVTSDYLEMHGPTLTPAGLARAKSVVKEQINPTFGERVVSSLRPFEIEKWRALRLRSKVAPATVNREWTVFRSILNFAERMEVIERNPIRRGAVASMPTTGGRLAFFSRDEWSRFIGAFDDPARWQAFLKKRRRFGPTAIGAAHDTPRRHGSGLRPDSDAADEYLERSRAFVPLFRFLLFTGARVGEVCSLVWDDVDFTTGMIGFVQTKTKKRKEIPMTREIRDILRTQTRGVGQAPVFVRHDGRARSRGEVTRAFNLAKLLAGTPSAYSVHTIRHTFASWLVMAGKDLKTVSELMGHADIRMTLRYAHLSPAHKQNALAALGAVTEFDDASHDTAESSHDLSPLSE
jgi:integrase